MKGQLNKKIIERFSRQIVLKDIGIIGQKKIISSKVLIVGAGGLGCPSAEFLTRAGVGTIGIVDNDIITLSNIHRQSLYQTSDVGKFKVNVVKINPESHDHTIELLEPSDDSSLIDSFLNKRGQGLHHIALEVDNIYNAIKYLKYNNVKMIYSQPQSGANNMLITFIHPSSTPGILIEICQSS